MGYNCATSQKKPMIICKMMFKQKLDDSWNVFRFKERLVAKDMADKRGAKYAGMLAIVVLFEAPLLQVAKFMSKARHVYHADISVRFSMKILLASSISVGTISSKICRTVSML